MILILKSENEKFLDILHKNPSTDEGLYLKELKNRILVGNAVSATEYHCVFQDTKYSYLPDESNQIDFQSFCSPFLALNIGTEFFGHLYKEKQILNETVISWLGKLFKKLIINKQR